MEGDTENNDGKIYMYASEIPLALMHGAMSSSAYGPSLQKRLLVSSARDGRLEFALVRKRKSRAIGFAAPLFFSPRTLINNNRARFDLFAVI